MILSFSITNFRSIKDTATIEMLPAKTCKELPENLCSATDKIKVLRSSVIYGANASGKTNVLKGLVDFIDFILNSSDNKLQEHIAVYDPFLLDVKSEHEPAQFKITFLYDGCKYEYSVGLDYSTIIYESLIYYPKGQSVLVFERNENQPIKFGSVLKGEKKSIEARLLPNQLFLSKAANENLDFLKQIYSYFSHYETFFVTINSAYELGQIPSITARLLHEKDTAFIARFENIIKSLDVGIHSFKINDAPNNTMFSGMSKHLQPPNMAEIFSPELATKFASEFNHEIVTIHTVYDNEKQLETTREFPFERESAGTKNLFALAYSILETLEKGSVYIIDEFEKSLHPQIVRTLVKLFHNEDVNTKNAQLIFSTHDISLLSNELFSRDQIWFTEKDETGKTELYALSEIDGVRNNVPYDKWYMSGRFGATPIIQETILHYGK